MGCCGSNSKEPKKNSNKHMNIENNSAERKNTLIWGSFIALAFGIFFMLI